jgi:hypothetical protein
MRNSNFARIVLLNQVPESPLLVSVVLLVTVVLRLEVLLISVALHLSEDLLLEDSELLLVVTVVMGATMEITIRFSSSCCMLLHTKVCCGN